MRGATKSAEVEREIEIMSEEGKANKKFELRRKTIICPHQGLSLGLLFVCEISASLLCPLSAFSDRLIVVAGVLFVKGLFEDSIGRVNRAAIIGGCFIERLVSF